MVEVKVEYRRGEYKKSAARRQQILDAAVEVFAQSGYTVASLSEVARRVGMTPTGILHHFRGGKTALLQAIMEQRDADAIRTIGDRRGIDLLRALLEITASQIAQKGMVQMYRLLSTEALNAEHPAHEYFRSRFRVVADAVERAFRESAEDGDAIPGIDPIQASVTTMAMTEGVEVLWLNGLDVDMVEAVRKHMQQYLVTSL